MKTVGAAVAAAMIIAGANIPARAEVMNAATLEETFSGMSLIGIYEDGSWFSEIYAPDGSISYVDDQGHWFGEWHVSGTLFCTDYEGVEGVCLTAERISSNCFLFAPPPPTKGQPPSDIPPVYGWSALAPTTCEISTASAPAAPPQAGGK